MEHQLIFLAFILGYILTSIFVFSYFQKAYYSKNGKWNLLTPTTMDVFMTFFPVLNFITLVLCLLTSPYKSEKKAKTVNIFKPK